MSNRRGGPIFGGEAGGLLWIEHHPGGCASNPGLSYQAIVSRWLNVDFVNLGFSGNGLGEPELAEAITEIPNSAIVLDFWANPSLEIYTNRLSPFIAILRRAFPTTPILVLGPLALPQEKLAKPGESTEQKKRNFSRQTVEVLRKWGDKNIWDVEWG